MTTRIITNFVSTTAEKIHARYLTMRIYRDILALSRMYPNLLEPDKSTNLLNAITAFISNKAVAVIGFSIYNPNEGNKVYYELKYEFTDYEESNAPISQEGGQSAEVEEVLVPSTAKFIPWVVWSVRMQKLPIDKQRLIIQDTGWTIPGEESPVKLKYEAKQTSILQKSILEKSYLYYGGLVGNSTTDAPPPVGDVKKKKRKGK